MKLENILPKNNNYVLKNNIIYYKKIYLIEILSINSDGVYMVSLDNRIAKQVLTIIKTLQDKKIDFIFWIPDHFEIDYSLSIRFFLSSWIENKVFYDGFKKINFNPIKTIANFCIYYNCTSYIKEVYDDMNNIIQKSTSYTHFGKYNGYRYDEEVRDKFAMIWRQIVIMLLLNKKK